ncbi:MAG: alanine--tRNA ligase [Bacteroidetes bacterium]|uniref:Alanine--tRNA ligase n=1 Tax=Candidatus Merdivivens pullicola TaxID=2840872 RepID=A0A9D9IK12_9BACT|nr:alanine--tRNA ligase [Candidatus Merdivivens pullicola]
MTSKEIRRTFLEFFKSKGHTIVPSASMVVKNDPTLMFTNAGMNQFKEWFLGNTPAAHKRVADTQKCLRVSGKHNDLEEVGRDSYHHTMFEMLGNWSFGDYFKNEAIDWAWELLTEIYKIDKERLYATVFEGDASDGTEMDKEAYERWKTHLPESRILTGNKKDNFWEMGDTGPCGPCSEIHIDLRSDEERAAVPGRELVNKGHHLVIEIWNLVFMQYNRKADGHLEPLPNTNVDTGMGFERLCMVLQGKQSSYDTDIFSGMIAKISELCGMPYREGEKSGMAMRVIADHIRAISFSIADGQLPSNNKAGYVIRRILRRAVRYGYTFLGFNAPFLCRLVPQLVSDMGEQFPEIAAQQPLIEKVIKEEEEAFLRTLDRGIKLMDSLIAKHSDTKQIPGEDAFVLYDTFGFPIDLSGLIAEEHGYTIDLAGFEKELGKQKERARNATAIESGDWIQVHDFEGVEFTGYDTLEVRGAKLVKYRQVKAKNKVLFQIVFDRTPFYAESGGQAGDTGACISENGNEIRISNTVKENNLTIHISDREPVDCEGTFTLKVDAVRRQETANNHSATHLLHRALRNILGTHVEQKGSFVTAEYFRFDFSHFEKMTQEQISEVERTVNSYIRENSPLEEYRGMPIDKAREMGAMALFGEKYGDTVRVVKFGDSVELCGGTHTSATGNIGFFKIVSESAIAAGVRRIEAVTGKYAENAVYLMQDIIRTIRELMSNTPNLTAAIKKLVDDNTALKKELEEAAKKRAEAKIKELIANAEEYNGIKIMTLSGSYQPEVVKNIGFSLLREVPESAFIAAYEQAGKPQLLLMYSPELVEKGANAVNDIREAAKHIMGGGGGQATLATAGGKKIEGLAEAFNTMLAKVKSLN